MCTAITYRTKDFYMGRTLDFDFAYPCEVTVMPRHFPLQQCKWEARLLSQFGTRNTQLMKK